MFRVGQMVIVKRRGRYCTENCGEPCAGQRAKIVYLDENNHVELCFVMDDGNCSNFSISDIELIKDKKTIKTFGIVKFINSLNVKEEVKCLKKGI